ncbi:hypothetical protein BHO_0018800 (plasmid) [Borrelia hermsii YBT]|uniref:Uncharacterized protein n=1 Tax=Borrelia hermsii YBT TaxID=1313295 RepID=W5T2F4_BORHE|nr:hypothetical protein BHO_0018800 [Borrelia hermsii YBT]
MGAIQMLGSSIKIQDIQVTNKIDSDGEFCEDIPF